jgi:hypothetical protein
MMADTRWQQRPLTLTDENANKFLCNEYNVSICVLIVIPFKSFILTESVFCDVCIPPKNKDENRRPIPPSHRVGDDRGRHVTECRPPKLLVSIKDSIADVVVNINPIGDIRLIDSHS